MKAKRAHFAISQRTCIDPVLAPQALVGNVTLVCPEGACHVIGGLTYPDVQHIENN